MIDSIYLITADPVTGNFISDLFQEYGVTGLAFGVLLYLMLKYNKDAQRRIEELEKEQHEQHNTHLDSYKAMVADYVDLVRNKIKVLADLTGCLKALKDTMERIERKQDKEIK